MEHQEVVVEVAEVKEAVSKAIIEVANHKLLMVIVPMEKENLNIKRRLLTLKMERKSRLLKKRKSKEATERKTREPRKWTKILITTSITTLQDPNTKEPKSLLIPKFHHYLPKKRERSNQIKPISTRK